MYNDSNIKYLNIENNVFSFVFLFSVIFVESNLCTLSHMGFSTFTWKRFSMWRVENMIDKRSFANLHICSERCKNVHLISHLCISAQNMNLALVFTFCRLSIRYKKDLIIRYETMYDDLLATWIRRWFSKLFTLEIILIDRNLDLSTR